MTSKSIKILKIIYSALIIVFSYDAVSDWKDRHPLPINSKSNTDKVDVHYNSGGRRIVRIKDYIVAICPHNLGERTYRSSDNGLTWHEIDDDGSFSGTLLSGPNETIFHFYRSGKSLYMVRFKYNETPSKPKVIFAHPHLSDSSHDVYKMVNATVDRDGVIYVVSHWRNKQSDVGDSLFLIRSFDGGNTWTKTNKVISIQRGNSKHSFGFAHMDVTKSNKLVLVYSTFKSDFIKFASSSDKGVSWSKKEIASGNIYNPAILPIGENDIYVFAQSNLSKNLRGLVMNHTTDSGTSWNGWKAIDKSSLSGYADPSPGLGVDGSIYVAYRSGARPDLAKKYGGKACRERLAMSKDGGSSWSFPDEFFYTSDNRPTFRTGTRSQIRYQTWFNYGGPLEWIWMQFEDNQGTNRPCYYDINKDILIHE